LTYIGRIWLPLAEYDLYWLISLLLAEYAANQKCSAVLLCSANLIYPLMRCSGGGHEAFQAELESRVETEASASWSQLDPRRDWSEASGRLETKANFFSGLVLTYFSLLCADVNCDFVLIFIVYCVILILILYCTTTYYYVLFHWRYMYVWYVLLNSTYLLTTPVFWDVIDDVTTAVSSKK